MKEKQAHTILKIGFEKTFDRIEWSFIRQVLNFSKGLSKCIISCISTLKISILVKRSKIDFFQPSRGIRQGDPLSPYIFILSMELLSRRIDHEMDILRWTPISICRNGPEISHLFFADDLLLFAKVDSLTTVPL